MPIGIGSYGPGPVTGRALLDLLRRGRQTEAQMPLPEVPQVPTPPMFQRPVPVPPGLPPGPGRGPGIVQGQGAPWNYQEIPGGFMQREEGPGVGGREWALGRQGPSQQAPQVEALEGLFRRAFAAPTTGLAPGARELAQQQIRERIGESDFERMQRQKEAETIRTAQTQLAPPVQEAAEAQARRAALPSSMAAKAQELASVLGLERERERAGGVVESRRAARDAAAMAALTRSYAELAKPPAFVEETEQTQAREQRAAEIWNLIQKLQRGELFLSDLFGDEELDSLLAEEEMGDEFGY